MKRSNIIILSVLAAVVLTVCGICIKQYYHYAVANFVSHDGEAHAYHVHPEMAADSLMAEMLEDYDMLSELAWCLHCRYLKYKQPKPGYYRFAAKIGNSELIRRLMLGEETPVRLSFTHAIRTREQLAGHLGKRLLVDSIEIIQRLDNKEYMAHFGLTPETAVCMFIPNTYEVYWNISAEKLLERLEKEANKWWENQSNQLEKIGLSRHEVVVLASIVEEETNKNEEKPTIAGVYINRLKKDMLLQADPTVKYAVGDFTIKRVMYKHLQTESPYNTYLNKGLPPTAICLPELSSLKAVLNYQKHNYMFFCAKEDFSGYHNFATTPNEHYRNAERYKNALNKLGIK